MSDLHIIRAYVLCLWKKASDSEDWGAMDALDKVRKEVERLIAAVEE